MKPSGIILHCSDSPHRGGTAEDVHRWHLKRGWDGIGYHFVILDDGTVVAGRPEYWIGSHAKGYNDYLGIMMFGKDTFTKEQFEAQLELVKGLMAKYKFSKDDVMGHNKISPKTCPNYDVDVFKRSL